MKKLVILSFFIIPFIALASVKRVSTATIQDQNITTRHADTMAVANRTALKSASKQLAAAPRLPVAKSANSIDNISGFESVILLKN